MKIDTNGLPHLYKWQKISKELENLFTVHGKGLNYREQFLLRKAAGSIMILTGAWYELVGVLKKI